MHLKIAERVQPFSHVPGISCLIPQTPYCVQAFPGLLRLFLFKPNQANLELLEEIELHLQGPIQQWTFCQDLEKNKVTIWGLAQEGWFRYHLSSDLVLSLEKGAKEGLKISYRHQTITLQLKESFSFASCVLIKPVFHPPLSHAPARLSLGSNRLQDWSKIKKDLDLHAILPIWYRLGQFTPVLDRGCFLPSKGMKALLEACQINAERGKPEEGRQKWLNLLQAGFGGLLVPRLIDEEHQRLVKDLFLPSICPLMLLTEGATLIGQLFIRSSPCFISVLPHLLPEFHAGRLLYCYLENQGQLDIEWTKKTIRRMIFFSLFEQELTFHFASQMRSYRLRQSITEKGKRIRVGEKVILKKNHHYFFDNFE